MFCSKCGTQFDEKTQFCQKCGSAVGAVSDKPAPNDGGKPKGGGRVLEHTAPTLVRFATAVLLSVGIATLAGCSLLFPSTECSGEAEAKVLSQLLVQSGAPGGALLAAFYGNNALTMALRDAASNSELTPVTRGIKAVVSAGPSAFDFQAVITTERKSRKSVVCRAEAHLAKAPPPGFPKDEASANIWKVASNTHWSVNYTAQVTDKGDQVLVGLESAQCIGPACALEEITKQVSVALQGVAGDELLTEAARTPPPRQAGTQAATVAAPTPPPTAANSAVVPPAGTPQPPSDEDLYVSSASEDFSDLRDKGYVFLAKVQLEGPYFDTWAGRLLNPIVAPKGAEVHLISQGKSGTFGGILTVNCGSRTISWERAGWQNVAGLTTEQAVEEVEQDVITATINQFCR